MDDAPYSRDVEVFSRLNERRRAVRTFDGTTVPDDVLRAIVAEAQLAPSSRNSQPYRFVCVRGLEQLAAIAPLCNGQAAACSAAALIVVVTGKRFARETVDAWDRHLSTDCGLGDRSVAHYRAELRTSRLFLSIGSWPVWSPLLSVFGMFQPTASLLPVGGTGIRHWTARNAMFAAQTLLLAASAYGIDTCPMEGFDAIKLRKALGLPRDSLIPLVIAVGRAAVDARIEPRWRKPIEDALVLL
ncbi:MAG: nitroreductase family protein [Gemmatimonadaceae bacterium]